MFVTGLVDRLLDPGPGAQLHWSTVAKCAIESYLGGSDFAKNGPNCRQKVTALLKDMEIPDGKPSFARCTSPAKRTAGWGFVMQRV